ncbi:HAMP domain-containing histidine kinase [Candidatus Chloroploca sp. M-50]|uniref:histidine kinase n=1 Tax=Candidatus Chloroploca mongolica TaxID=2528176 RepID=A0ABS4DB87_9CHLR|nr:HAMP domain-containing sensor histidine kinase [Candidatus Chloroploca mongolica]MBP1466723.1 HAMP domain-containing histidine kinase [Candidatus Chloroploca mongolica]
MSLSPRSPEGVSPHAALPWPVRLMHPLALLLFLLGSMTALGYPISLFLEQSLPFSISILLLFLLGHLGLLLLILWHVIQTRPLPLRVLVAGTLLFVAQLGTIGTSVFWSQAYSSAVPLSHPGIGLTLLTLWCSAGSLCAIVPAWKWHRLHVLHFVTTIWHVLVLPPLAVGFLLPLLFPDWTWTAAQFVALTYLGVSLALFGWYGMVAYRYAQPAAPIWRLWTIGMVCFCGTSLALLFGALRMDQGLSPWLFGMALPCWMLQQVLWTFALIEQLPLLRVSKVVASPVVIDDNPRAGLRGLLTDIGMGVLTVLSSMVDLLILTVTLISGLLMRGWLRIINLRRQQAEVEEAYDTAIVQLSRLEQVRQHQQIDQLTNQHQHMAEVTHDLYALLYDLQVELRSTEHILATPEDGYDRLTPHLEQANALLHDAELLIHTLATTRQLEKGLLQPIPTWHDAHQWIMHVVALQQTRAREIGVSLNASAIPAPCMVWGDHVLLARALANLVRNAIQATGAFRSDGTGVVEVRIWQEAGRFQLQVEDNGPGMPIAQRVALRQWASRGLTAGSAATEEGSLGLKFIHRVVSGHPDGHLRIVSAAGIGTTAIIDLPAESPSDEATIPGAS